MKPVHLLLVALAGGSAVGTGFHSTGRGTAEDLVPMSMVNVTPGVHHIGLTAPDAGRLVHLEWTTHTAGSGVGSTSFDIIRESDDSVLCTAVVPCTQQIGQHVHVECAAEIIDAEHLDVAPRAPGCALMPQGVLVASFLWQ